MKLTKQTPNLHKQYNGKRILLLVSIGILLFTSCSRYQFVTIDSNLYKNEKQEFVAENDTILMKYSFSGTDFPLTLTLFNKLQQPLYIDYDKSTVIMNDVQINGAFDIEGQDSFIAPQSFVTIKSNKLSDKFIPLSPQDQKTNVTIQTTSGNNIVQLHTWNQETSPVFLRSIVALTTHEDFSTPFFFDHPFWVSGVFQTMDLTPANRPANQFSMEKTTGFATAMGTTAAIALLVVLVAITPAESE